MISLMFTLDSGVHDVNVRGFWGSQPANMFTMSSTSTTSAETPAAASHWSSPEWPREDPTDSVSPDPPAEARVVRRVPR